MADTLILFTADCHMKRRTWTNSTLLKDDATVAFCKAVVAATRHPNVTDIVIGGDLFDSNRPTAQDLLVVKDALTANFNACYYIRGNHDNCEPSYLEAITGSLEDDDFHLVHLGSVFTPMDIGVWMTGLDWSPSASEMFEKLRQIVKDWRQLENHDNMILYVVLHCSFQHLLGFDGAYDFTVDMIKDLCGEDHINFLVGHIHTRDTLVYNSKGAYIHSPGSLYPLSTDKMGEQCYASLINLHTGEISDIASDVRKYVTFNIGDAGDDLISTLNAAGYQKADGCLPTFVRLIVPEDWSQPIPVVDNPNYVVKVDRQVSKQQQVTAVRSSYSINQAIRDELADQANRDMVVEMAEELLASDDPVGTLDGWLEFWGVKKC